MPEQLIDEANIKDFLEGRNKTESIVAIEAPYNENKVYLIVNDKENGKKIVPKIYKPFVWLKHEVSTIMYGGDKVEMQKACLKHGVTIKGLTTAAPNGITPERLKDGYKYLATTSKPYTSLIAFFAEGGIDIYSSDRVDETDEDSPEYRSLFVAFTPAEQFCIQTGIRLFKGMDDYDDVHKLQFDLETQGLVAATDPIFQIGIRDNRGFGGELGGEIIEVRGDTEAEKRNSERNAIIRFFKVISEVKPDIITAYNDANFDWPYIRRRCDRLGLDIEKIAKTLNPASKIRWSKKRLKLGGESIEFEQTMMWGYNILDISHSVRKAKAINSNIKKWGLKYITEFSGVAKKNRVYVDGDKIHKIWADPNDYWFNNANGAFGLLEGSEYANSMPEGLEVVKGDYIVQRYLIDDLWETAEVDNIYNQASFLIGKLLPTSYMRSSTMGTAGQWKLIMAAWSYENNLAIPSLEKKRDFTGGLARLLEVGYAKNVVKLDFAALYPKEQLTHDIFPSLDISGVMKGLLTYIVDTRDRFKFLLGSEKKKAKELQAKLEKGIDAFTPEEIEALKIEITKHKNAASDADKKQLPLKILANSFFGALGAPYLFQWGDTDCAEETTCRGRQYLRLMVRHFTEKYKFRALVGDTDGFNFASPDDLDDPKNNYIVKASHWKTEKYEAGTILTGLDAVLADFNEKYMEGRMGLDIDDVCESTINFARKNYANKIDGKVKLVGNSVKSDKMSIYIEEFLNKGIRMLLDGEGYEFIQFYYEYVDKIYNYDIPVIKIASKGKVKKSVAAYKAHTKKVNKAGKPMPRQAHMELMLREGMGLDIGETIFYINTGTMKSHADIKTITAENGDKEVQFNCKVIPSSLLDTDPEYTTDEYNIPKYLDAFNKRVKPLWVCFNDAIRKDVVQKLEKNKETKEFELSDKKLFTKKECELIAGNPLKEGDQDTYEQLMTMDDKEIRFWTSVEHKNIVPNNIDADEWIAVKADYFERMRLAKIDGIQDETEKLDEIFKRLEVSELKAIETYGKLPIEVTIFVELGENDMLVSKKWEEPICPFADMFKYESDAKLRESYFQMLQGDIDPADDKYELWLDHLHEESVLGVSGSTMTIIDTTEIDPVMIAEAQMHEDGERKARIAQEIADAEAAVAKVCDTPSSIDKEIEDLKKDDDWGF